MDPEEENESGQDDMEDPPPPYAADLELAQKFGDVTQAIVQAKLSESQIQSVIDFIQNGCMDPRAAIIHSKLDGIAIVALVIIGILSDIFSTTGQDKLSTTFFTLAIAIVAFVTSLDNLYRNRRIETGCTVVLAFLAICWVLREASLSQNVALDSEFKQFYFVFFPIMIHERISITTAIICLLYFTTNLLLANYGVIPVLVTLGIFINLRGGMLRKLIPGNIEKHGYPVFVGLFGIGVLGYSAYVYDKGLTKQGPNREFNSS